MGYYTAGVIFEYTEEEEIAQKLYKKALEVVDVDITLSVDEKLSIKGIINASIK
jgi:hypothetical protein